MGSSEGPGGPEGPKRDQGGLCLNDSDPGTIELRSGRGTIKKRS